MLNVKKGAADNGFAPFYFMDSTAGPTPSAPEVDVLWEVLTDHLCQDNFGNHMPRDLYCVEVKVGNNSGHSLQLAGVGFLKSPDCTSIEANADKTLGMLIKGQCTGDSISTPNISYQTARASAQAGQSTTARNLIVNGVQGIGLLMASFTPYFTNSFNKSRWSTGVAIVGTALAQAINIVAPDQTIREINNLDDQAFRDGKLIPNNTQVRMLVFVQKKSLAEAIGEVVPKIQLANEKPCTDPMSIGYKQVPGIANTCYPGWEDGLKNCIAKLECNPVIVKLALGRMVLVGDTVDFIQRVVIDPSVASQEVPVPGRTLALQISPTHATIGAVVTISGSGFGAAIGKVTFTGASGATVDATPTVAANWNDSTIKVTVPPNAQTGSVVVTPTGGGAALTVGVFTVDPTPFAPAYAAIGAAVTISGSGFGAAIGKVTFTGAPGATVDATPTVAVNWNDSTIKVTVPPNAQTGNVVVTPTGGGAAQTVGIFTIP